MTKYKKNFSESDYGISTEEVEAMFLNFCRKEEVRA